MTISLVKLVRSRSHRTSWARDILIWPLFTSQLESLHAIPNSASRPRNADFLRHHYQGLVTVRFIPCPRHRQLSPCAGTARLGKPPTRVRNSNPLPGSGQRCAAVVKKRTNYSHAPPKFRWNGGSEWTFSARHPPWGKIVFAVQGTITSSLQMSMGNERCLLAQGFALGVFVGRVTLELILWDFIRSRHRGIYVHFFCRVLLLWRRL
jgi:hypothetical protein